MNNALATNVSVFGSFYDNQPIGRALKDVVNLAMSEPVKKLTLDIRRLRGIANDKGTPIDQALEAKNKADKLKKGLPSFLTDVYCEHGKKRCDIVRFLPFVGFDVDHITEEETEALMELLKADPHVVIAEPSCSRMGVHFMILTDAADWLNQQWVGKDVKPYEFVWHQAKEYVEGTFNVEIDVKCMNPEHIFGICYDEMVHYKENPEPLHIDPSKYIGPAEKVANGYGFDVMSGTYQASVDDVADRIISRIEQSGIYFAEGSRNDFVLRFALAANKYGVSQCETESFCITNYAQPDFKDGEIRATVRSAYGKTTEHGTFCATSAKAPSAKYIEKTEKTTIFGTLGSEMAVGGMAEVAETPPSQASGYTFSDKLNLDDLIGLMRTIFNLHGKEPAKCDAQIIGTLNAVGGLMGGANGSTDQRSGIYGIYDGRRVYAPLYNIVYSGAGNDKGNLIFCKFLLYAVKCEMRRKYEAERQEYEQQLAEWEAQNKKDRGAAPKEPVYRDPFVPGNSSSSAVYRAIDANGGWGMMFETEADTISSMIDSDYGNYSDLMRKAHHHETLSMNRVTEKVHIDIDEPRLSIFLTCTPGQLPALFPSFENGLGSRFLFYNTPDDDVDFHDVFAMRDTPLEDTYKKLGDDLLPLYHALQMRAGHPIQFVMSQSQQREFVETYSGILGEQFKMLGKGIRAFVFRIALECFRYAMILTTLRRLSDWQQTFNPSDPEQPSIFRDDENALVCDDRDFRTAMAIIGCLINHTARVYAVMAKEDDNPFAQKGIKLTADEQKVYNALPEGDFRTCDFVEIADGMNIAERTAQRMLSQFCSKYCIVNPVRRGLYRKPSMVHDNDANHNV